MRRTSNLALFALGALLMGVPGLFTAGMKWAFVALLAAGYLILVIATIRNGSLRPTTGLMLLIATNLSFWLSYGLWLFRMKYAGPSPGGGIDAFAGPVALWLILLLTFFLYEAVVFVRGLTKNQERMTAAIGLVASAVQVLATLRTAYGLVQGV
jgi:hypothetical protein